MAIVNSDFLAGVLTNFRSTFNEAFHAFANQLPWKDMAMEVKSNTDTETHNWLGTVPVMQDVTGKELELENLFAFNYSIANLTYKAGIPVNRATFEDDKLGLITPKLRQLAQEAARHPGQLIFNLPVDNGLAFDATAFFADTRVIGRSANIDNILVGTGTTVAQFQADLAAARAAMRLFQDDMGRPMNLVPNILMVPAGLEQVAYQAVNANQGDIRDPVTPATIDGAIRAAGYLILVNPYLVDANDWYALHSSGEFKPFIYQTRISPALEGVTNPNTESGVIRDTFIYSVRARYNVGYGDPRLAIRTTNT